MIITDSISEARKFCGADLTLEWGLVPTMGYLHDGHLSLVRRARNENDRLAVSIFVNPKQFSPGEDLNTYPRDVERDLELLKAEGVDLVFTPGEDHMYPIGFQTKVQVEKFSLPLEGKARPTHFQGVTTIVAKLFNIMRPNRAYFGQKDAQQCVVVRQMVADLDFAIEIVICPIVREPDGLAMSSRNIRLTSEQRRAATVLFRALSAAEDELRSGERDASRVRKLMRGTISAEPLARLDYASAADPITLTELDRVETSVLLSMAVYFESVRLIDNILVQDLS